MTGVGLKLIRVSALVGESPLFHLLILSEAFPTTCLQHVDTFQADVGMCRAVSQLQSKRAVMCRLQRVTHTQHAHRKSLLF